MSQVGRDGQIAGERREERRSTNGVVTTAYILNALWLIGILRENIFFQVQTLIQISLISSFLLNKYLLKLLHMLHTVLHFLPLYLV